ncbi:TonB-dependent receptor plug domain-containing protein [Pedobacter sp. SYSU D00535]|uniref:TonB-dependent receptor n=1 Tax=Pedobacter sp. SYSU D00535 TaxID=2810308 RepID=UPI001A97B94B|nr:TonB-dependent receptor plug domain-containing protein [Pedobacter sp. SYSU D00535]
MKHSLLAFLVSIFSVLVKAQTGTVSGIVSDENGKAVPGATVMIKQADKLTATDDQGKYQLTGVAYGEQLITVISMVTAPKSVSVKINQPKTTVHIRVQLADEKELKQVTIVGKTEKRKIETSGFAVNVVDTKEAASRNIQTNELLDRTVGVRVRQSGGIGSQVEYNLNGMTGRAVGIFIDGLEISTYGSSFNLNNIPPALIERIEVYKGVLPGHLSGDLLGGAINIVLKKGSAANNLTASASYGSFNTFQSDVSANYRQLKSGFTTRFSGFYTSTDNDYEQWGRFSKYIRPNGIVERNFRTKRFFDGYRTVGGRLEAGFTNVKWADVFLLGYNASDSYKEIQHGQTMGRPYMGRTSETQAHVLGVNYKKSNLFVKGLDFNLNAAHSFRNTYVQDTLPWAYNWDGQPRVGLNGNPIRTLAGAQQGAPMMDDIDRQITNVRSNLSYALFKGHRLSLNEVFYAVDRQDQNLLAPLGSDALKRSADFSKNVISINYEAETFGNRLATNLFTKIYQQAVGSTNYRMNQGGITQEILKDNRVEQGYGLAVSYQVFPNIHLITSAERAIRMPDDDEIFGSPDRNVLSNHNLRPEMSDNYNVGFRLGTFDVKKHKLSVYGNMFGRKIRDRIMPQANELLNSQEIEETQFVNISSAQSIGFEGEVSYTYNRKLVMMVNFSKFNSLLKNRASKYYNTQLPNEPFFTINANAHYRLDNLIQKSSELNLFYTFGYVAPFKTVWPESDDFVTPTQYSQNVGLSYTFPSRKIVTSLDVKNILNAEIYDNFAVQKPGRAFYLKINYIINNF